MTHSADLTDYAAKMRQMALNGTDLAVDARFVDMLSPRRASILDIGCGIGSAVAALRAAGHDAFGIDPTPEVLRITAEFCDDSWFRQLSAADFSPETLADNQLPTRFDVVLISGNVPAFLTESGLAHVFTVTSSVLNPGGRLVVGTTTHHRGGPTDLDRCAAATSLSLEQRYSDWHLSAFDPDSSWSVSVFNARGPRRPTEGPDGIHVLPTQ
jgi:SAM-dependent methyltransferase